MTLQALVPPDLWIRKKRKEYKEKNKKNSNL